MKEILDFLRDLREKNNSEWFHANKERYDSAYAKFLSLVGVLNAGICQFDESIQMIDPKKSVFRIYRDVRFSKDKTPYKVNFGGFICKGGRNSCRAGYYLHIEPDGAFVGGGIYMPPTDTLKSIRQEIYNSPEEFLSIINEEDFRLNYPPLYSDDKLKVAPKGFPKDFKYIDLLKYKSYTVMAPLKETTILSPGFADFVLQKFEILEPFNAFLNRGIDYSGE